MLPIPPCSVFSTPQFASFSLLISYSDHKKNTKEITYNNDDDDDDRKSSSYKSNKYRFGMIRGEPTILVASPSAFVSEELCIACLDELHEFLAIWNERENMNNISDNNDNGVIVDLYQSKKNGMALYYMLIKEKEMIQSCIQWLQQHHPLNNINNNNSIHEKSRSSVLQLQGLVLCVGVSGSNPFYSVVVSELPSRIKQTLSLLPSIFASNTSKTTLDDTTPHVKTTSVHQIKLKEHHAVQGDSSSSSDNDKTKWIRALLASLMEEEEHNESSMVADQRQQPKEDIAISTNKKGGVENITNNAIICLVGGTTTANTTSSSKNKATSRYRMEVEQMEVMAIHDTTMSKKSLITTPQKQQESLSPKPQQNKKTTYSLPSLHGFDYIPPEVLPPITVLTTTTASSSTIAIHNSSPYYNNHHHHEEPTNNVISELQKPTWSDSNGGGKQYYQYPPTNSKISEDISSCNSDPSAISPHSEITTPTTATMLHPTSTTSTTTLSNPLVEVEKTMNYQNLQQQQQKNIETSNGWNNTAPISSKNESIASTKNFYRNTTNTNSTSSSSSILQHSQDEETNTFHKISSDETMPQTATSKTTANYTNRRDTSYFHESSITASSKHSYKINAVNITDTNDTDRNSDRSDFHEASIKASAKHSYTINSENLTDSNATDRNSYRRYFHEASITASAKHSFAINPENITDASATERNSNRAKSSSKELSSTIADDGTTHKEVIVSTSSKEVYSSTADDGITTSSTNEEDDASAEILPNIIDHNGGTLTLTVSVALNEDVVCSFYNSKLLHCHVNGLIQLHVATESSIPSSPTGIPSFVVVVRDPSQHIYALKASQEYTMDIGNGDDKFLYLVRNIPEDRFVPLFKYKCNDNLCPIPLRVQMKSRIVKESYRLRLSLQISSNPEMENVLSDLDVIIMNIPTSITLDTTTPKGGKFNPDQSTVSWSIPKLNVGEKIQLHAYFQLLAEDGHSALSSLPVVVRCFGLYSQLSDIQVRLRDAATSNVDSPPLDFKMKLARRFRVLHQEQQDL